MEKERVISVDRNRILTHAAGLALLITTLAAYKWTHPTVDLDSVYPKPACFEQLDPINQQYFLHNREFIVKHPDVYSPATEDVLLHVDCPVENMQAIESPESSVLGSITP